MKVHAGHVAAKPAVHKHSVLTLDVLGSSTLFTTKADAVKFVDASQAKMWVNTCETCPHFCVLGGAVNYQGLPPLGGNQEVIPGPEIPFVYPRLLALPGVVAVISSLPMEPLAKLLGSGAPGS
jgi:hypothetical protein